MFLANGGEPFVSNDLMLLRGNLAQSAPVNSAAPVITGTAQIGNTLTTTNGTWTGTVTSYSRQWYVNTTASTVGGTPISGEVAASYFEDAGGSVDPTGKYIYCGVIAHNWGKASAVAYSNIVGPVAAATGLTAPTMAVTSAAGAAPTWNTTIDSTEYAGYYLRIQVSPDGAENVDGSGYTTVTQDIRHLISDTDLVNGIPHSELVADGIQPITGTWHIHERIEREDGVVSPWATEITGTVTSAQAVFAGTNGVDKSQYLTITNSGRTATVNNTGINALAAVRVEPAVSAKSHIEFTIASLMNTGTGNNGDIACGVCDETESFSALATPPGDTTNVGVSLIFKYNSATVTIWYENGTHNVNLTGGVFPAVGDIIALDFDPSAKTITATYLPAATGIPQVLINAHTLASNIPTSPWNAFFGAYRGSATNGYDGGTMNSGQSAFAVTPLTGYSGW